MDSVLEGVVFIFLLVVGAFFRWIRGDPLPHFVLDVASVAQVLVLLGAEEDDAPVLRARRKSLPR
jgi:hypothetical protein